MPSPPLPSQASRFNTQLCGPRPSPADPCPAKRPNALPQSTSYLASRREPSILRPPVKKCKIFFTWADTEQFLATRSAKNILNKKNTPEVSLRPNLGRQFERLETLLPRSCVHFDFEVALPARILLGAVTRRVLRKSLEMNVVVVKLQQTPHLVDAEPFGVPQRLLPPFRLPTWIAPATVLKQNIQSFTIISACSRLDFLSRRTFNLSFARPKSDSF